MPGVDGTFWIWSEDNTTKFIGTFGDGAPIVTEGYAGWQIVNRPKDVGLTVWQGRNPMAIEIPFLIDNLGLWDASFDEDRGVLTEDQVTNIETLCGLGTHAPPPACYVDGGGIIPHDYSTYKGHRWVVEQLTWDRQQEVRSQYSSRRLKCGGMITIRQFITPSELFKRIGQKDRAKKPNKYLVKSGDTLEKIAALFYGDANQWKKIANANNMRDPRSLQIGKTIRIP